ncbi:MAG: pyridoxamine 5'-phosphate oxidase family protein [Pseudomonadota bacterium]
MPDRDHDPYATLSALFNDIWTRIGRGVADRRAPARHPILATSGVRGGGEARVVVLRAASRAAGTIEVHTDAASAKVAELQADPRATLLIWDEGARLQIRLRLNMSMRPGTEAEWAWVPDPSRRAYGGTPPPGAALMAPDHHDPTPSMARFMIVEGEVLEIDALFLGAARHKRALFRRETAWEGEWIAP